MPYIFDETALLELESLTRDLAALLDSLSSHVEAADVCFTDAVVRALGRYGPSQTHTWAKLAAKSLCDRGPTWPMQVAITDAVPGVIDYGDEQESAAVTVLGQARAFIDKGLVSTIVTEDRGPKPTRTSVAHACGILGVPVMATREALYCLGLGGLCS